MPFNMFPYSDLQTLNLDWLLKALKDLGDKYESLEADLNGKTIAEIVTEYLQQLQDSGTYNGTYAYGQYRYQQPATSYAVSGDTIDFDTMINPRDQGIYCVTDTGVNIVNGPTSGNTSDPNSYMATPTNAYFMFEIKDITGASGYCVQTVTVLYHDNPHKFERVINYGTGNASTWNVLY